MNNARVPYFQRGLDIGQPVRRQSTTVREAAKHARLLLTRFLADRASFDEIEQAVAELRSQLAQQPSRR